MNIPTPETDAVMVDPLRDGNDMSNLARKLERERDQLQRWKEEMLAVWKKWDAVEAAVRKHPDAIVGQNISDTVLRFIKERDELSWTPVTERMPTEEDANAYGDVEWSDGKVIAEASWDDQDKKSTHWRRIVLP